MIHLLNSFGKEWQKMLDSGEAPKESMFAKEHSKEWHEARELCKSRVDYSKCRNKTKNSILKTLDMAFILCLEWD